MTVRQRKRRRPRSGQRQAWRQRELGDETKGEPGTLIAHHGVAVLVRLEDGNERMVKVRRRSGHVVGDRVEVLGERLIRRARDSQLRRRDAMGRTHVVAANLDILGLVVAPVPATPTGFVDRALVAARSEGISPFIVVNKADLPGAAALVEEIRATWIDGPGGIDIPLLMVCATRAQAAPDGGELDELIALFGGRLGGQLEPARSRRGAFVGTSGVGKSSLVNALLPTVGLEVGDINAYTGLGRHTTTTATLHALPRGGELIDTPGFRDFGLVDVDTAMLTAHFPGFAELCADGGSCRFSDCRHASEPDCAIKAAVADGRLAEVRWRRYHELLASLETR